MLTALGWTGARDDVCTVATDVFRDHLLNFKIDAARHWGEEFWKQQPTYALREAAEADSTDLFKEGGLVQLVLSRQEQRASNRLSPARVDSASEQVLKERTGAYHTLTHVDWVQFERDLDTLREFGKDGVPILTTPDFAPSTPKHNTLVRWAKNYTLAPEAVEALVYKAWTVGCGILLTPTAASTIEG